ncbi:MAG: phosphatase PAP2 family protein [Pseudomonadales bacterium]|nr:phosphatase PAP2 family protein [Pseudomonadales bacterium]
MNSWTHLYHWLNMHAQWVPLFIFCSAALEALAVVGIVIPGIPLLFGLTMIAGRNDLDFPIILASGIAGAMLGDGISFWLGKYFQHRTETLWPFRTHPQWLVQGEAFFHKHGGKSIVIGRFIGPLRTFVPLCAGILNMPGWRFTAMNLLSALAWAPFHIFPGYLIGSAFDDPLMPGKHQLWFLVGLALSIVILIRTMLLLHEFGEPWLRRWSRHLPDYRLLLIERYPEKQLGALLISLVTLSCFMVLTWNLGAPEIKHLDIQIAHQLTNLHQPFLDYFFVALSVLGYQKPMIAFGGFLLFYFIGRGAYGTAIIGLINGILALWLLPLLLNDMGTNSSPLHQLGGFPSIQALSTVMLWGFIGIVIPRSLTQAHRVRLLTVVTTVTTLILASSLYLGTHHFSETLGGVLLGAGLLALLRYAYHRTCKQSLPGREVSIIVIAALVLITVSMVLPEMNTAIAHYAPLQPSLAQHRAMRIRRKNHHLHHPAHATRHTLPTAEHGLFPAKSHPPTNAMTQEHAPQLVVPIALPQLIAPHATINQPDYSSPPSHPTVNP